MNELNFKIALGAFVIFANFFTLFLVIVFYLLGGFTFDEMTTSVALIVPMFSVYTSAIVKFIYDSRYARTSRGKKLGKPFVVFGFSIVALFATYLSAIIFAKAYNYGFGSFENFKIMLAMSEAIFGIYLGVLLTSTFPQKQGASKKTSS